MSGVRQQNEEKPETGSSNDASAKTVKAPRSKAADKAVSRQQVLSLHLLSINQVAVLCLGFVFLLHLGALTLFTKGFLLNRTTLDERNTCALDDPQCTLEPKFDRAVIVLIDALRYDFLFPVNPSSPEYDPSHHNLLTTPIRLSRDAPQHSLLYKAVADPPTTTLQRLKAITTGSLPTFIDAGSNFAGSQVEEDNWLEQANRAGKRIAFMGDDTWLTIFPESIFAPNLSFPFDSFNVEDLDTVDAGVNQHIIPLLDETASTSSWDILFAHPLGLDHAGHRFGASHAETTRKLKEMDILLGKIVDRLAEKDLLIVLGDHGMDAKGDHGGDSPEETDAGLWLYSRTPLAPLDAINTRPFPSSKRNLKDLFSENDFFTLDGIRQRSVPQISLVPTLSLLLGFAIPLNNLGTIIPELFVNTAGKSWLGRTAATVMPRLEQAMMVNALQIKKYLQAYAAHSGGSDLAPFVPELLKLHERAESAGSPEEAFASYRQFTQSTLEVTRGIWARFDPVSMVAGVVLLAGSLAAIAHLYKLSQVEGCLWRKGALRAALARGLLGLLVGSGVGLVASAFMVLFRLQALAASRTIIFFACLAAELAVFTVTTIKADASQASSPRSTTWLGRTILFLHTAIFASNSYILWEDWVVLVLVQLPPLYMLIKAFSAPESRLRWRIASFSIVLMVLNRAIAFSSICREEQHPYCTATFYGSSGTSIASPSAIFAALAVSIVLPLIIGFYLDVSKSRQGWAPFFLAFTLRGALLGGAMYWGADYLEHAANGDYKDAAITFKVISGKVLLLLNFLLATTFWAASPLCIDVQQAQVPDQTGALTTQVTVIGFANSIGSTYLMFCLPVFAIFFLLAQPIGQVVMALGLIGFLSYLEANDSTRDAVTMQRAFQQASRGESTDTTSTNLPPSFLSICAVVLSGFLLFFATGHQAVLSSIQWKIAFVGFPKLTYPISPILVVLNTIGPFMLSALLLPLLVFWNVTPSLKNGPTIPILSNLLNACLGFLLYHTAITLSSAIFAAHLRRHLMVWKVFAPRFMLSAMILLAVDLTLLVLSVGWGSLGTFRKLAKTFGTAWS